MAIRLAGNTAFAIGTIDIGTAGHKNFSLGGWFVVDVWTDQFVKSLFGAGHSGNGRAVMCGSNNDFPNPQLHVGDSQTGITGTPISPRPTAGSWYYIELSSPNTVGGTLTLRVSPLDDATIYTSTRTNGVEGSVQAQRVQVNRAVVGSAGGFTNNIQAYRFRGYSGPTPDDATFLTRKLDSAGTGALFFWPLEDSADTSDATGNGITPTFNGTITTTTSPTIGGGSEQHESGGSNALISVVSTGAGTASEVLSGGSNALISVVSTGAGTAAESPSGGSAALIDVVATGAGSAVESASGGNNSVIEVQATGAGNAAETASGGSNSIVLIVATGGGTDAEFQHESGGSASLISIFATGSGSVSEAASGGTAAVVAVQAAGGGAAAEHASGGSAAVILIISTGESVVAYSATLVFPDNSVSLSFPSTAVTINF